MTPETDLLLIVINELGVEYRDYLYTEGRDLVTINKIAVPAFKFFNTIHSILTGHYKSPESVLIHPNLTFDEVGNVTSRPMSIELAMSILAYKNLRHYITQLIEDK